MKRILLAGCLLLFGCLPNSSAWAACNYSPPGSGQMNSMFKDFYLALKLGLKVDMASNARTFGDACTIPFKASYGSVKLTSVSIASRPSHGTLSKTSKLAVRYAPQSGYKGIDRFSLRICGNSAGQKTICFPASFGIEVRCSGKKDCAGSSMPKNVDKIL